MPHPRCGAVTVLPFLPNAKAEPEPCSPSLVAHFSLDRVEVETGYLADQILVLVANLRLDYLAVFERDIIEQSCLHPGRITRAASATGKLRPSALL